MLKRKQGTTAVLASVMHVTHVHASTALITRVRVHASIVVTSSVRVSRKHFACLSP